MARKVIATYGTHGRSVTVIDDTLPTGRRFVRVLWREQGQRKQESWPHSREHVATAKAWGSGMAEKLARQVEGAPERLTIRTLGDRYLAAHPVPETWRIKTLVTFQSRWKVWVAYATGERMIDTVTPETLDGFRAAMRKNGHAVNQIAEHVKMVKAVWKFARSRQYLAENRIADYRMQLSRDQRKMQVPEWSNADAEKIIAQLAPDTARGWRPYVAIVLDALLGARANALLHLEWRDYDHEARTITWRAELDKLGKARTQPLPPQAVDALEVAITWRALLGYNGPFVFPSAQAVRRGRGQPWTYQALNQALRVAAQRAGVPWVKYRAMHGLRRMVVGDVLASTKNLMLAGQWIGDTDARTLSRSYVRERVEDLRALAESVTLPNSAQSPDSGQQPNDNQTSEPSADTGVIA